MERSGIYCIINRKNGKRYVGQSVHISTRVSQHFQELKHGVHPNKEMQHDYKTDWQFFDWEVLELVENQFLSEREYYWVNYYKTLNVKYGYNIQKITRSRVYTDDEKYDEANK